jgi:hypothetical protein
MKLLKLFNKNGGEIRPNIPVARPTDDCEPLARPSPYYGIFREVANLAWAHAQVGNEFVVNDGKNVLVLTASENYDGPRWDRLSLSLAPANWRELEEIRRAAEKAESARAAAEASARAAAKKAEQELLASAKEAFNSILVAANLPLTRTYKVTVGDQSHAKAWGYDFSSVSSEETRTVERAYECVKKGTTVEQAEQSAREIVDRERAAARAARALEIARMAGAPREWLAWGGFPMTSWLAVSPEVVLASEAEVQKKSAQIARAKSRTETLARHEQDCRALEEARRDLASGSTYWPKHYASESPLLARLLRKEIAAVEAANAVRAAAEKVAREASRNAPRQTRREREQTATIPAQSGPLCHNPFASLSF